MKRKSFLGKGICLGMILVGMNASFYHVFFPYINIMKFCIGLMLVGIYFTILIESPFQNLEIFLRKKLKIVKVKNPFSLMVLLSTWVAVAMHVLHHILRYQSDARLLWDAIQRRHDIFYHLKWDWIPISRYESNGSYLLFAIEFFLGFLMALVFYKRKSMTWGMLPPLAVVVLGLVWGKTPEMIDMVFLIVGTVGMRILMDEKRVGGRKHFRQLRTRGGTQKNLYPAIALLLAGVLLASTVLSVKHQAVLKKEEELVAWQRGVGEQAEKKAVQLVKKFQRWTGTEQPGVLTNVAPVYTEETVLTITAHKKPMGNMYLRGFTGTHYEDGVWTNPTSSEEDTFTTKDYLNIWNMGYKRKGKRIEEEYGANQRMYNEDINLNIQYAKGNRSEYLYVPYFSKISQGSELAMQMVEDMYFQRKKSMDGYEVPMMQNYAGTDDTVVYRRSPWNWDALKDMDERLTVKGVEWLQWAYGYSYEELAYDMNAGVGNLQIPETGLGRVQRMVDQNVAEGELLDNESDSMDEIMDKLRIFLGRRTDYSLELEQKPSDEDYLENFLMTQKKGYCEHYATAGAMIMRMLGIPSRYVSGYMVSPKDFVKNEDGTYTANVLDSAAHAWTEIYIPKMGWVEADMTPTRTDGEWGDSENSISGESAVPKEVISKEQERIQESVAQQVQEVLEENKNTVSPQETASSEVQKEAAAKQKNTGGLLGLLDKGEDSSFLWTKVVLRILCVVVILGVLCFLWWSQKAYRKRRLGRCKTNRAYILEMNHQMERYLRCCGISGLSKRTDKEYLSLLETLYSEPEQRENLKQYYQLLEQSRFAREDRSKEDIAWCEKLLYDFGKTVLKQKGTLRRFYVQGLRNWR